MKDSVKGPFTSILIETVRGNVLEPFERLLILLIRALSSLLKDSCNLQILPHWGLDFNINYLVYRVTLPGLANHRDHPACEVLCWGSEDMGAGLELSSGIPALSAWCKEQVRSCQGKGLGTRAVRISRSSGRTRLWECFCKSWIRP